SVAVVHLAQVSRAGEDVVARIERIAAETVPGAQLRPRVRHDLHQAHRAFARDGVDIAGTFRVHDGPYPCGGNAEASRGFRDVVGDRVAARRTRVRRVLRKRNAGERRRDQQAGKEKSGKTPGGRAPPGGLTPSPRCRADGHRLSPAPAASAGGSNADPMRTLRRPTGTGWRGSAG